MRYLNNRKNFLKTIGAISSNIEYLILDKISVVCITYIYIYNENEVSRLNTERDLNKRITDRLNLYKFEVKNRQ